MKISDIIKPEGYYSRLQFLFFFVVSYVVAIGFTLGFYALAVAFWDIAPIRIISLILILPSVLLGAYLAAVTILKRLADLNCGGGILLFVFIPVLNIILFIYLLFAAKRIR
jgi:hypothetical protein